MFQDLAVFIGSRLLLRVQTLLRSELLRKVIKIRCGEGIFRKYKKISSLSDLGIWEKAKWFDLRLFMFFSLPVVLYIDTHEEV